MFIKKILPLCLFLFTSPAFAVDNADSQDMAKPANTLAENTLATNKLEVLWDGEFIAGNAIPVTIKILNIEDGTPISDEKLVTVNSQKVHLLIIDPTFTDFQNVFPKPLTTPYAYNFTFTPKFTSGYRVWADITPLSTGKQEFLSGWLGDKERPNIGRRTSYSVTTKGYNFSLSFDKNPKVGQISSGKIQITGYDNQPVKIQPYTVLPSYIVGFYGDFNHAVNIHQSNPMHINYMDATNSDIKFRFQPQYPGFIKIFAQITLDNKEISVPFTANIEAE